MKLFSKFNETENSLENRNISSAKKINKITKNDKITKENYESR